MLYQAHQAQSDMLSPFRPPAQASSAALWFSQTEGSWLRKLSASLEALSRLGVTHARPAYNIDRAQVGERTLAVTEEVVLRLLFGTLLTGRTNRPCCWWRR